jgi:hypothetical protein
MKEVSQAHLVSLFVPVTTTSELPALLERGGFSVAPIVDDPWSDDAVSWQLFYFGQGKSIAAISIAILKDDSQLPLVAVHPCRRIFWWFHRRGDLRLIRRAVSWLTENGAIHAPTLT